MILLNPGGPGASGVDEALNGGSLIQSIVGTNWDIVGFDIRGGWRSEPVANCSGNLSSNQSNVLGSRSVSRVLNQYFIDGIESGKILGEQCEKIAGKETDAGPHMSTATIARDMLSVVMAFSTTDDGKRAAKPSNLLNYYGISYGTFNSTCKGWDSLGVGL
jgi:pimeloyl-ACP methyl ester carboxylesterase